MQDERSIPQDDEPRSDMNAPSEEPTKRAGEDKADEVEAHRWNRHSPVQDEER
jgi:hypothetical protein